MQYKYQEVAFGGLMLLVGIALLMHTFSSQYQNLLTGEHFISPMFYPRIILAGWCAMAAGMIINALKIPTAVKKNFNLKSIFIGLSMTAGLLLLINLVGFLIAATLFFFSFALFLKYKRRWIAAMAAVVIPYGISLIFEKALGIILPTPLWYIGG